MGHVALRLQKRLAPGVEGEFRILSRTEWNEIHEELERIELRKISDGRWVSGVIWLGEVDHNTRLIPAVLVGDTALQQVRRCTPGQVC